MKGTGRLTRYVEFDGERFFRIGDVHFNVKAFSRRQRALLNLTRFAIGSLGIFGFGALLTRLGGGYALDIVTGRAAGPGARTTYLMLFTTAPNDASTMASIAPGVETTMTGYARQSVTWSAPSSATPPETHNTNVLTFGPLTGTMATVTSWGLASSASGATGDLLAFGNLTTSRTPTSGDSLQAAASAISFTDE